MQLFKNGYYVCIWTNRILFYSNGHFPWGMISEQYAAQQPNSLKTVAIVLYWNITSQFIQLPVNLLYCLSKYCRFCAEYFGEHGLALLIRVNGLGKT